MQWEVSHTFSSCSGIEGDVLEWEILEENPSGIKIEITGNVTDDELIAFLVEYGFLDPQADNSNVLEVDGDKNKISILRNLTKQPILCLRRVFESESNVIRGPW